MPALALLPLLICGCGSNGMNLDEFAADRTLVTGSAPTSSPREAPDPALMSDRVTVRNAVSSALVEQVAGAGLGWANVETGSRGTITSITETRENDFLCRNFLATRESYEGIHIYSGKTCLGGNRQWAMLSFSRVD